MGNQVQETTSHEVQFDPLRVKPLPGQPRKRFRGIPALAASIKAIGQKNQELSP